jgi:DNA-binding response OmpR family regulator
LRTTSEGERATRGPQRDELVFRPGDMPPLFGDTAAALIVDDDEQMGAVLSRLLGREGYRCTIASNAADARAFASATDFAIALVDVMMPDESGLELAADMLSHHRDLAVVMVTGVDDPGLADLALESGAYGYVVKPFQFNQLLISVADAGRRRCLEIARRVYEQRLERRVDEQAADLDEARTRLEEMTPAAEDLGDAPTGASRAGAVAAADAVEREPSPPRTVLYVDDNAVNVELLKRILQRRPEVALLTATHGETGLELARAHQPALVLLDLNLPKMSGREVLLRLKAEPETAAIPVVIVSGDATPSNVGALKAAGATDYLTKPYRIKEVLAIIDSTAPSNTVD